MPTTTLHGWVTPDGSEQPQVHIDMADLAADIDAETPVTVETTPPHREGRIWYKPSTDEMFVSDGTNWIDVGLGAWVTYTPTFTGITIGAGTVTGKISRRGKTLQFMGNLLVGSGTVIGANCSINLPLTSANMGTQQIIGQVNMNDSGTGNHLGWLRWASTTTAQIMPSTAGGTGISGIVPFTWAASDNLSWFGTIELP